MKETETKKCVIIGIGNDGRRDDGLGWRFLDLLEEAGIDADLEYRYQLQIEDADLITNYAQVIFVDATVEQLEQGYSLSVLKPEFGSSFSTHAIPPAQILGLCSDIYNNLPEAIVLAIKGYEWNLEQGLTEDARKNLLGAFEYFRQEWPVLKSIEAKFI